MYRMAIGVCLLLSASSLSGSQPTRASSLEPKPGLKPERGRASALAGELAERKERASGRSFAPGYRRQLAARLSKSLSIEQLAEAAAGTVVPPAALGESSADLVFTPLVPCRILDTRLAGGAIAPNTTREFLVAGSGLDAQGGEALGCGVPFGPATAVAVNMVAVGPSGPGNVVAFAWDDPPSPAPNAALINFGPVAGLSAFANGVIVPICDSALTTCEFDLFVLGRVSSVHLVVDVVGYFSFADITLYSESGGTLSIDGLAAGDNFIFESTDFVPGGEVECIVTSTLQISSATANTADFDSGLTTAVRDVDAGLNYEDGSFGEWYSFLPIGEHGTVSKTSNWLLAAGTAYRFGCYVSAFGPYVGDDAFCSVAYVCR